MGESSDSVYPLAAAQQLRDLGDALRGSTHRSSGMRSMLRVSWHCRMHSHARGSSQGRQFMTAEEAVPTARESRQSRSPRRVCCKAGGRTHCTSGWTGKPYEEASKHARAPRAWRQAIKCVLRREATGWVDGLLAKRASVVQRAHALPSVQVACAIVLAGSGAAAPGFSHSCKGRDDEQPQQPAHTYIHLMKSPHPAVMNTRCAPVRCHRSRRAGLLDLQQRVEGRPRRA